MPSIPPNRDSRLTWLLSTIVKGWTGNDSDQRISHGEGLAHLLDAAASRQNRDPFEENIRDTLYVTVVSPIPRLIPNGLDGRPVSYSETLDSRSHIQPKDTPEPLVFETQGTYLWSGSTS